LICLWWV